MDTDWDLLGPLQFNFLLARGLKPRHTLLDLGCGSFRGGRHFIRYLDPGNDLGMDKQQVLIDAGREHEIPAEVWAEKRPEVVVSDSFDVYPFTKADFVLAQSLLTHLTKKDIKSCLRRLRGWAKPEFVVYASICESRYRTVFTLPSHSSRDFYYTREELARIGAANGWTMQYIGDWGHPHRYTK